MSAGDDRGCATSAGIAGKRARTDTTTVNVGTQISLHTLLVAHLAGNVSTQLSGLSLMGARGAIRSPLSVSPRELNELPREGHAPLGRTPLIQYNLHPHYHC